MKRTIAFTTTGVMLACMCLNAGCASMTAGGSDAKKKKKDSSWSFFKKKEYQTPQSMNVTWGHDILMKPGKPPTRGFGGRFYFYNEKSQTIPVDGELIVYGFDDTKKAKGEKLLETADKKFCFTAEQFTTHFSESQLGASYSVWIPWDAAPGSHKQIMLIPTFTAKDGHVIRGTPAVLHLPGSEAEPDDSFVVNASNLAGGIPPDISPSRGPTTANPSESQPPRTTTIMLPHQTARGLSNNHANAMNGLDANSQNAPLGGNAIGSGTLPAPNNYGNAGAGINGVNGLPSHALQNNLLPGNGLQSNSSNTGLSNNAAANALLNSAGVPANALDLSKPQPLIPPPAAMNTITPAAPGFNGSGPNGSGLQLPAPPNWPGQPARSLPNQLPAPASSSVLPNAYQPR